MKLVRLFTFMIIGLLFSYGAGNAAEQTFAKPKQGAYRVDWCYQWGAQCGQPAADRFCKSRGYFQSNDFVEDPNIGNLTPTVVQASGQICNGPDCDGFTYITCVKPDLPPPPVPMPPPGGGSDTKVYKKPKIGGARLAYCFRKGKGCDGQTAADAYCEAKGWDDAADFNQSSPLTVLVPTRYIGNGRICRDPICFSFSDITCENN